MQGPIVDPYQTMPSYLGHDWVHYPRGTGTSEVSKFWDTYPVADDSYPRELPRADASSALESRAVQLSGCDINVSSVLVR